MPRKLAPVHPGELLKETLADLGLTMIRSPRRFGVPANRISAIVAGTRSVTANPHSGWRGYFAPRRSTG